MNLPHDRHGAASPQEWLKHALSDLKMAKLAMGTDILPEQISFHAQQAAEKSLKTILMLHEIDFPLTHDIQGLLDILREAGITVPDELLEADALTPYAVQTRYPGYWGKIATSEVAEAIEIAERAVAWAIREVGGHN